MKESKEVSVKAYNGNADIFIYTNEELIYCIVSVNYYPDDYPNWTELEVKQAIKEEIIDKAEEEGIIITKEHINDIMAELDVYICSNFPDEDKDNSDNEQ